MTPMASTVPITKRLVLAVFAALIYGLILYLVIWVGISMDRNILPVISGLILMPMAIASIAKILADPWGVQSLEPHLNFAEYGNSVTTVIEINAPPSAVWQQTVEIPEISPDELPFSVSHDIIGVPRPQNAEIDGSGQGATRNLRWSKTLIAQTKEHPKRE